MPLSKKTPKKTQHHSVLHRHVVSKVDDEKLAKTEHEAFIPRVERTIAQQSEINEEKGDLFLDDSIDSKKQFFRQIAEQIKEEQQSSKPRDENESEVISEQAEALKIRPVNLYRKIVIRFALLVVVLAVALFYFSFTKLTITVKPNKEMINDTMLVDVYSGDKTSSSSENYIKGTITRIEAEENGTYDSTGEKDSGGAINGKVKIENHYSKNQPLVANTRLLSADNKLFRIKNTVDVPAGGSVVVEIYADKVAPEMAVEPGKFTIPGLWDGLQDKIYAVSDTAFTYGGNAKKYVKQSDVDAAIKDLNTVLLNNVKARAASSGGDKAVIYDANEKNAVVELDGQIGDEKDKFSIKLKNIVTVISFSKEDIKSLAKRKLASSIEDTKTVSDINEQDLTFSVDNLNTNEGIATLKVYFTGSAASSQADFVDRSKIVNLNQSQLDEYLKNLKEIESYKLVFFPSFIKKSPHMASHIKIVVE